MVSNFQRGMINPKTVLYYITNVCNLSCKHCAVSKGTKIPHKEILTTEEVKQLLNTLKETGIKNVSLTGGEPFMREDIYEILEFSSKIGLTMIINTNLTIIPEKFEEIITNGYIDTLYISVDGANAQMHDYIRGSGSFDKTLRNLEYLQSINIDSEGLPLSEVIFSTVLTRNNINELKDIFDLGKKFHVSSINLEQLNISGNAVENSEALSLEKENLLEIYEKIFLLMEDYPFKVITNYVANAFIEYFNKKHNKNVPYKYFACPAVNKTLYISYDGCMVPCAAYCEQLGSGSLSPEEKQKLNLLYNEFENIIEDNMYNDFFSMRNPDFVKKNYTPCNRCKFIGVMCNPCISKYISNQACVYDLCTCSLDAIELL